eukprot:2479501-Pleurochrysis_carterae.AAC.5
MSAVARCSAVFRCLSAPFPLLIHKLTACFSWYIALDILILAARVSDYEPGLGLARCSPSRTEGERRVHRLARCASSVS